MINRTRQQTTASRSRIASILVGSLAIASVAVAAGSIDTPIPGSEGGGSAVARAEANLTLTPLVPARVLETRVGSGFSTIDDVGLGGGRVKADSVTPLRLIDRAGIPGDATAVAINVTAIRPDRNGYITLFPCDLEQPTAANLNYSSGQIISNAALVPLDDQGQICIYSFGSTDLTVDVNGFVPQGGQPNTLNPARYLETRSTPTGTFDGVLAGDGRVEAASVTRVPIANRGGVVIGAAAVTMSVTVVNPATRGFLTVFPCDQKQPTSANLNHAAGQTIANSVFSQLSPIGEVCIYSQAETDLVVDVTGFVDGFSEPTAVVPVRLLETRVGTPDGTRDGEREGEGRVAAQTAYELPIAGRVDIPDNATAALLNVTAISPGAAGFLTIFPCDAEQPQAANLVYGTGDVIANAAFAKLSDTGTVCVFTQAETHLVVDVTGFVVGSDTTDGPDGTTTTTTMDPSDPTTTLDPTDTTTTSSTTTTTTTTMDDSTTTTVDPTDTTTTSSTTTTTSSTSSTIPVSPDTSVAPVTTAPPSSSPTSGDHEVAVYQSTSGASGVARWNPCGGPIRYQVRVGQASSDQILYLNDSIAAIEYATGFDLQFVGTTTSTDWEANKTDDNVDALIMFNTEAEDDGLIGNTIGIAGSQILPFEQPIGSLYAVRGNGNARMQVDHVPSPGAPWSYEDEWRTLILHELGHMMGLKHVGDPTEVMYPFNIGVHPFQDGDLEGLWKLGTAQPCQPDPFAGAPGFQQPIEPYSDINVD